MTSYFSFVGKEVARVGFGAMQLPGKGVFGPPRDHEQAIAVLRRAVEAGVNHIDTAQYYGPNVSNELIKEALHPYGDDLVIVSKVGGKRDDKGNWLPAQSPEELRAGVEQNLQTLGVEQLGAVNLRLMDEHVSPADRVPLEDQLATMVSLREEGKIAGVGISTATFDQVQQAVEQAQIVCVQNQYSYLTQDDGGVLDLCTRNNIAFAPYFPLGSAFPGTPKVTEDDRIKTVAQRHDATPAQIGQAWLLQRADNVLLIPGTSSLVHLEENLAVGDIKLSDEDLQLLEQ